MSKKIVKAVGLQDFRSNRPKVESYRFAGNPAMAQYKDLKPTDFCLENVVAADARHLLHPTNLEGNIDATIANVGNLVDTLDSIEVPSETPNV